MTWIWPKTNGPSPSPRRAHTSVIWHGHLYIFGGGDGARALNDVYALNLKDNTWSLVETTGARPEPRGYHSGTLVGDKLVIYGGSDGQTCFGDIHLLDLSKSQTYCITHDLLVISSIHQTQTASNVWHRVNLDPQIPRLSHAATCIGSYLFVTGGHDGAHYCNDLLMLNFGKLLMDER